MDELLPAITDLVSNASQDRVVRRFYLPNYFVKPCVFIFRVFRLRMDRDSHPERLVSRRPEPTLRN